MEERFELKPYNKDDIFIAVLMLNLFEINEAIKNIATKKVWFIFVKPKVLK